MGVDDVKVSEPSPVRQELARRLGATQVVSTRRARGPRAVRSRAASSTTPVDVVLECSGHGDGHGGGARPAASAGAGSCSSARAWPSADVRPEPHPAERARDHRRVLLRRRRLRARARAARVRELPLRRAHRSRRRALGGALDAMRRPRRRPDRRQGPHRPRSRVDESPASPRLNHVAMSMPADALDAEGARGDHRRSTATCSGGRSTTCSRRTAGGS